MGLDQYIETFFLRARGPNELKVHIERPIDET